MLVANKNVIIIGAGAAGVYCGYLLKQQGYSVTILEARDRTGGRTYTVDNVDLGGAWISTQQPTIYDLCQKFNLELIPQYEDGNSIFVTQKSHIVSTLSRFKLYNKEINDKHSLAAKQLNQLAQVESFNEPSYQQLDRISVIQWLKQNFKHSETIENFASIASNLTARSPDQISTGQTHIKSVRTA